MEEEVPVVARICFFMKNPEASAKIGEKLSENGFTIMSVSDYGVSISASRETFEDYFGDIIETKQGYHFKEEVLLPEPLYPTKSLIYFPSIIGIYS